MSIAVSRCASATFLTEFPMTPRAAHSNALAAIRRGLRPCVPASLTRCADMSLALHRLARAALRAVGPLLATTALLLAAAPAAQGQAASPYRFTAPTGWAHAVEGDIETLTPQSEGAGSVQLMLIPPKPASGDFAQQFDAERTSLEAFWGLRAPAAVPPQSGQASVGRYAAHFASYDSDSGPRYMGFMALGTPRQLGLLVFVASSDDAFNRLVPQAIEVFRSLSLANP